MLRAQGCKQARTLLGRFAEDARGGFAIMLAVSVLPLTLLAGVSVDVSALLSARNQLQAASDEAALALARQPNLSQTDLNTQAAAWLNANLNGAKLTSVKATPVASASQVAVTADAYITTPFLSLIQMRPVPLHIQTASVVKRALKHVELALVLDNTGSMTESDGSGSTKSATLKSAATSLIDALVASAQASGQTDAFKVAMVPFATYVNIKNLAPNLDVSKSSTWPVWMPGTSDYANDLFPSGANRFSLLKNIGASWAGCVESRPMPYDVNDAGPTAAAAGSRFVPFFSPDEPDFYYYGGNNNDLYGNDYITDTAGNYSSSSVANADWKDRQSDTSKYKSGVTHKPNNNVWGLDNSDWGPNQGCPNVYAQPLTTNYNSVKSAINALSPDGNTHIPFGLAWGWYMLSPNMPFGATTAYADSNTYKIAVLVTDGANTYQTGVNYYCNNYYSNGTVKSTTNSCGSSPGGDYSVTTGYGYVWQARIAQNGASTTDVGTGSTSDPASAMNDRLVKLCRNMQAKGVILYTVPLRVTDANTKAMLQGCASPDNVGPQGAKYLEAQSGDQLKQVFANIAGQISALRLAQ